jgi:hypothetical protein
VAAVEKQAKEVKQAKEAIRAALPAGGTHVVTKVVQETQGRRVLQDHPERMARTGKREALHYLLEGITFINP